MNRWGAQTVCLISYDITFTEKNYIRRCCVDRQVAAAKTQPVRAVQAPLDLGVRTAQSGTDLFALQAPPLALPFHRVVGSHPARHAQAENLFQPLLALQFAMRVAALCRLHRKALAPGRPESDFQKAIGLLDASDFQDAHFF